MAVALLAACGPPHVQLNPPKPNMTADERVAMFEALAGKSEKTTWTTTCNGGCSTTVEKSLFLANGTEVHYPEDLLPVLPADGEAVEHIRANQDARSKAQIWTIGAVISGVTGFLIFASSNTSDSHAVPFLLFGGAAVGAFGAWHYSSVATDEASLTFHAYSKALADRLAVCTNGLAVVACE